MKNLFLLLMISLTLTACDQRDKKTTPPQISEDADNTDENIRDRDSMTTTPLDQSEEEGDLMITKKIRQKIMADEELSTNAKNIKIITINGVVTLRGPVLNTAEKDSIAKKIRNIQGIKRVDNQLEVTRNQY